MKLDPRIFHVLTEINKIGYIGTIDQRVIDYLNLVEKRINLLIKMQEKQIRINENITKELKKHK